MKLKTLAVTVVVAGAGAVTGALMMSGVFGAAAIPERQNVVDDAAFEQAVDVMTQRYELMDAIWLDDQLREALPNVEFSIDGAPSLRPYGGIVEGHVTAVAAGAGFVDEISDDGARTVKLEFDSANATTRTIVITIEVKNDLDSTVETPATVQVGLVIPANTNPETMMSAFEGRHILAVLEAPGAFPPPYGPLRIVARAGGLLGFVGPDDTISMPFLGHHEGDYLNGLTTLEAVVAASEEPKTVINVAFAGRYLRVG